MKQRKRGWYRGKICLTQEQIEQVRRDVSFQKHMAIQSLRGLKPIIMIDHKPNDEMTYYDAMAFGLTAQESIYLPAQTMEQVRGWQTLKLLLDDRRYPIPLRAVHSFTQGVALVQTYTLNGRMPACRINEPSSGLPLQPCGQSC